MEQVRARMPSLVSRDPSSLTAEQATAATVESVSENMNDSFLAPWLFFALFGLPGAFAYRMINTLDSMIGYRGVYEHLGKASARLDDLVNLIPARLGGLLLVAASGILPDQRIAGAWRIMWQHHGRTQSPNAGWTMSGMAGALGVQLQKVDPDVGYTLGEPNRPIEPKDITRAVQSQDLQRLDKGPAGSRATIDASFGLITYRFLIPRDLKSMRACHVTLHGDGPGDPVIDGFFGGHPLSDTGCSRDFERYDFHSLRYIGCNGKPSKVPFSETGSSTGEVAALTALCPPGNKARSSPTW
jgi:hypothetical protein